MLLLLLLLLLMLLLLLLLLVLQLLVGLHFFINYLICQFTSNRKPILTVRLQKPRSERPNLTTQTVKFTKSTNISVYLDVIGTRQRKVNSSQWNGQVHYIQNCVGDPDSPTGLTDQSRSRTLSPDQGFNDRNKSGMTYGCLLH